MAIFRNLCVMLIGGRTLLPGWEKYFSLDSLPLQCSYLKGPIMFRLISQPNDIGDKQSFLLC